MQINSIVDLTHLYLKFKTEYKRRINLFGLFNKSISSSIDKGNFFKIEIKIILTKVC